MTLPTDLPQIALIAPDDVLDSIVDVSETGTNPNGESSTILWHQALRMVTGGFSVENNVTSTPIAVNTPIKLNAPTIASPFMKYFTHTANRLTWNHPTTVVLRVDSWVSLRRVAGTGDQVVKLHLYKNDNPNPVQAISARGWCDNADVACLHASGWVEFNNGDYVENWIENLSGNNDLIATETGMTIGI